MKTKEEPTKYSITKKVEFRFVNVENVQSVTVALAMAGYFVRVSREFPMYVLHVYTDRE